MAYSSAVMSRVTVQIVLSETSPGKMRLLSEEADIVRLFPDIPEVLMFRALGESLVIYIDTLVVLLLLTFRLSITSEMVFPVLVSVTSWVGTTTVMPSVVISADDSSETTGTNSTAIIASTAMTVIVLLNDMF